jgi:predicted transcriptional regulator
MSKLDKEIKAAAKELKRTPDDLYELAVEDLRDLRTERDRVAATLEAAEAASSKPQASADKRATKAIAALQRLAKAITSTDNAVAREALAETVERIEVWFDHVQHKKLTRSHFRKGIISFRKPSGLMTPATRPS